MKFDIVYHGHYATIEPHLPDPNGDPGDGYELEEACDIVAVWFETQARKWRDYTHPTPRYYLKEKIKS
jgi:hypothetical protein